MADPDKIESAMTALKNIESKKSDGLVVIMEMQDRNDKSGMGTMHITMHNVKRLEVLETLLQVIEGEGMTRPEIIRYVAMTLEKKRSYLTKAQ